MGKLSLVAALALGGLLACANLVSAQDAKEGKQGKRGPSIEQQLDRMKEQLKLTDEQVPKVKAVLEDGQKKRQELRDVPQDQRREKMQAMMAEQDKKYKEILTPSQYEEWQKMRDQMKQKRGGKKKSE